MAIDTAPTYDTDSAQTPTGKVPEVYVFELHKSDWARRFEACISFSEGRQHDHCEYTGRGARREPGLSYLTERYKLDHEVTVREANGPRKPDCPVPVAKDVVGTLTGILLGAPPILSIPADLETQSTIQKIWSYGEMQAGYMEARDMAGGGRAAVVVSTLHYGKPGLEIVRPSECVVLEWSPRECWQPSVLLRQYLCEEQAIEGGKVVVRKVWKTTVWTEAEVIVYQDVPHDHPREKPIPVASRVQHFMGCCPATWYRNTKAEGPWGRHDFEQAEPMLDAHDRMVSDTVSGVGNNLDPTVVDQDEMAFHQKYPFPGRGRGVVIKRGPNAKVHLLESDGSSLKLGLDMTTNLRNWIYDSCEVPQITPSNVASYKSGEAIRLLWRKATIRAARLWPTLEAAIRRSLMCFVNVARTKGIGMVEKGTGGAMLLPGNVIRPDKPEPGEQVKDGKIKPHTVAAECYIQIAPGPYFDATPAEKQSELTTLATISGSTKIISAQTATEQAASVLGVDPVEELKRVMAEEESDAADAESALEAMQQKMKDGAVQPPGHKEPDGDEEDEDEEDEDEDEEDEDEGDEES